AEQLVANACIQLRQGLRIKGGPERRHEQGALGGRQQLDQVGKVGRLQAGNEGLHPVPILPGKRLGDARSQLGSRLDGAHVAGGFFWHGVDPWSVVPSPTAGECRCRVRGPHASLEPHPQDRLPWRIPQSDAAATQLRHKTLVQKSNLACSMCHQGPSLACGAGARVSEAAFHVGGGGRLSEGNEVKCALCARWFCCWACCQQPRGHGRRRYAARRRLASHARSRSIPAALNASAFNTLRPTYSPTA